MCFKKFSVVYRDKKYRFSGKQYALVCEKSLVKKELDCLNDNAGKYVFEGLVENVNKTVYTARDLNKLRPEKLFKELVKARGEFYRNCYTAYLNNLTAHRNYTKAVDEIQPTPTNIAESIKGISKELFTAIEAYYIQKNKIGYPIEPYIRLVIYNPRYHDKDVINIKVKEIVDFMGFSPTMIKNPVSSGLSVTSRINEITQPRGGFIPPSMFTKTNLSDGITLNPVENVHSSLVGICVDYLSRYICEKKKDAFEISFLGAKILGLTQKADSLFSKINGLDDASIINSVKLCGFDVAYRAGSARYVDVDTINPNKETIENIKIMVNRSLAFFQKYGPVVKYGFTFEGGGYTKTVSKGDGDFLTQDTLWDFKTISGEISSKYTLQLLMYYIMGKHSKQSIYNGINYIGIFNPRKNEVLKLDVNKISNDVIRQVEKNIICY